MASLGNLTQSQHPVLIYTPTTDHVSTDYPVTNLSATLRQPMDSHDSQLLHSLYFWLFGVLLCIVALIGISTNAINVYVLSITVKKNHRPMYHFLICMAVMDLLIMVILLIRSIRFYLVTPMILVEDMVYNEVDGFKVDYTTYIFFNIWYIAIDILMTISNWSTVAMGLFRLVAVFLPLRAASLCTVRRAQGTILLLCILGFLFNLPLILAIRVSDGLLVTDDELSKYSTISLVLTLPMPIITCLIINVLLIWRIRLYRSKMQNLFEGRNHHCKFVAPTSQASSHQQAHAVGTLISVSMFYVVMSMPNVAYYSVYYADLLQSMSQVSKHVFYLVANLGVYISHACNFFFYMMLNKPFRNMLWVKLGLKKPRSSTSSTRISSLRPNTSVQMRQIHSNRQLSANSEGMGDANTPLVPSADIN